MSEYDIIQLQSEVADIRTRLSRLEREQGAAGGLPLLSRTVAAPVVVPDDEPDPRIYPCAFAGCTTMRSKAEGGATFTVCDDHWQRVPRPTPHADKAGPAPGHGPCIICGDTSGQWHTHAVDEAAGTIDVTPEPDRSRPAPGYHVQPSKVRGLESWWCWWFDNPWGVSASDAPYREEGDDPNGESRKPTREEAIAATWEHAKAAAAEAAHAHAAQQPATSGRGEATVPDRAALKGAYCQACGLRLQGVYVGINGERVRCDDTEACDERAATPPRTRSALTVAADAVREAWNTEGDTHAAQALRRIENELRALEAAKGGE